MSSGSEAWLQGVFALMLTPFGASGAVDIEIYDRYVAWQVSKQPAGLFAVCGTSEMKWLTLDERLMLARRTVAGANGLPVLATANLDPDPRNHSDELRRMIDTGVNGVVLVPAPSISGDANAVRDYIAALAAVASCPIVLYEWPQVENYLMDAETFGDLVTAGQVQGIKDTTCTPEGIAAKQQVAGTATVFQANTPFLLDALDMGVRGLMMITSSARCDLVVRLWSAHEDGDTETAAVLERELVFLDAVLRFAYPAAAKYLVSLQGIEMPLTTRWPVTLTSETRKALETWQRGALRN